MYKFTIAQSDKQKHIKKPKEIKLLSNYVPLKKSHFQSNISEYETEPSIQKNFSYKCQKNYQKPNLQAKSVQIIHSNQLSPKNIYNNSINAKVFLTKNKSNSNRGSFYNLNYLKNYDYSNEKKLIENKNNKINTLKRQLSLYIQQINLLEKNNSKDNINDICNSDYHSANNKSPKILYINKNNNKYMLINNNSYVGFPSNNINNDNKIIGIDLADKKLEKKLSNFLTENNSDNNFKNNYKNNSKNNILNIIYQSKKGGFKHNNINLNINIDKNYNNIDSRILNVLKIGKRTKVKKKISFKNNNNNNYLSEKGEKNNIYFYTNKEHDQKISIMENKNNNYENDSISTLDIQYKTINDRVSNLFNSLFDFYNQKNIPQK